VTATPGRGPAWHAWATAAAVALTAAAIHASMNRGEVLSPLSDESLLLPIALRQAHPSLYVGDKWLATTAGIFSVPYSWLVATLLSFIDDPVVAMRLLSIPAHVALLAGTWRLVERFAGRTPAALATLLVALPPCSILVFAPGGALPRDLVFAALPWLTIVLLDAPSTRRAAVVFFGLGVLANLHPLTGLHFAALLLLVGFVVDPTRRGLVDATTRGIAFAIGAAPYAVQYLSRPAAVGSVDPTVYAWRLSEMAGESVGGFAARTEPAVWMSAAAAIVFVVARRRGDAPPRLLVAAWIAAFVLGTLGPTLGRIAPPLRAVQLGRFERIGDWCAVVVFGVCVVAASRARAYVAAAIAGCCLSASATETGVLDDGAAPRGPIARVGRALDRRMGVPFAPPAPSRLVSRKDVPDPTSPAFRDDFLAVCRFARERTNEEARFLVPPEHWAPFRVYARRGVAVTRKEGGAALSFLGAAGMAWFSDYEDVVLEYAAGGEGLAQVADGFRVQYVVVDAATPSPPSMPEVFAAGNFRVLDARRK
jgi:uncharacterized membrane protein YjjB (DUF3815 family)